MGLFFSKPICCNDDSSDRDANEEQPDIYDYESESEPESEPESESENEPESEHDNDEETIMMSTEAITNIITTYTLSIISTNLNTLILQAFYLNQASAIDSINMYLNSALVAQINGYSLPPNRAPSP
jgi:hypothetical protein